MYIIADYYNKRTRGVCVCVHAKATAPSLLTNIIARVLSYYLCIRYIIQP